MAGGSFLLLVALWPEQVELQLCVLFGLAGPSSAVWEGELLVGILVLSRGVPVSFQDFPCPCRVVGLVGSPHGEIRWVPHLESQDVGHHSCHWFYPLTESVRVGLGDLGFAVGLCQVFASLSSSPSGCLLPPEIGEASRGA